MAADNNEINSKSDKTYMKSIASYVNSTIRRDLIKKILEDSFQNSVITNDALSLVVEVAQCIVIETCVRAAAQALSDDSREVKDEHVQKCLPQIMLDFP